MREKMYFELGYIFCKLRKMCADGAVVRSKNDVCIEDYVRSLNDTLTDLGIVDRVRKILDEVYEILKGYEVGECLRQEDSVRIRKLLDDLKLRLFEPGEIRSLLITIESVFGGGSSGGHKNRTKVGRREEQGVR